MSLGGLYSANREVFCVCCVLGSLPIENSLLACQLHVFHSLYMHFAGRFCLRLQPFVHSLLDP